MKTVQEAIEAANRLIEFAGDNKLLPCDRGAGAEVSCFHVLDVTWGRPLTKKEFSAMCSACLAYWHLSAARNDLIAHARTRCMQCRRFREEEARWQARRGKP